MSSSVDVGDSGFFAVFRPRLHAMSDGGFLAQHVLAAVVTALGANSVINMPCTAVGALSDGGNLCHVVRATLGGTGLRLSTFRMCHFSIKLFV